VGNAESLALLDVFSLQEESEQGLVLIDSGATESVGPPEALNALCRKAQEKYGTVPRIKQLAGPDFRLANGQIASTYSKIEVDTPLGTFAAYCMEGEHVPILMSIKALRALGATIDFAKDEMTFHLVRSNGTKQQFKRKLNKSPKVHLMFNLLDDSDLQE